jgi:hypothetical protein
VQPAANGVEADHAQPDPHRAVGAGGGRTAGDPLLIGVEPLSGRARSSAWAACDCMSRHRVRLHADRPVAVPTAFGVVDEPAGAIPGLHHGGCRLRRRRRYSRRRAPTRLPGGARAPRPGWGLEFCCPGGVVGETAKLPFRSR